jgi:hypothetical protein
LDQREAMIIIAGRVGRGKILHISHDVALFYITKENMLIAQTHAIHSRSEYRDKSQFDTDFVLSQLHSGYKSSGTGKMKPPTNQDSNISKKNQPIEITSVL